MSEIITDNSSTPPGEYASRFKAPSPLSSFLLSISWLISGIVIRTLFPKLETQQTIVYVGFCAGILNGLFLMVVLSYSRMRQRSGFSNILRREIQRFEGGIDIEITYSEILQVLSNISSDRRTPENSDAVDRAYFFLSQNRSLKRYVFYGPDKRQEAIALLKRVDTTI